MTTRYEINARLDVDPRENDGRYDGYNACEWFRGAALHRTFATPEEAEAMARAGYVGPDADGLGVVWTVDPVAA